VVPVQTAVTIEITDGMTCWSGLAALTSYVEPGRRNPEAFTADSLKPWLGRDPTEISPAANPYEPARSDLRAVVELAVLDALGRLSGLPATAFLGGRARSRLPVYASLPSFPEPTAAVECAVEATQDGFRAVKFHASGLIERDLETIALARGTLGPAATLMWDGSCAYDLPLAVAVGRALERNAFTWFEAPMEDGFSSALLRLARTIRIPLIPDGMELRPAGDWVRDLGAGIWGALRLDVTRARSLADAVRLVHIAEALGYPCEVQSFGFALSQYANLQLMLTSRACTYFEAPFPRVDLDDFVVPALEIADGFVSAPTSPGLGHNLTQEHVKGRFSPIASLCHT
jgi:L-alanine-DL-glutamate epimerase-like enolase superfamily enzyme